ncbi:bifunctional precorrin-2 dehydrogenase/sirohydrochlorin ferrochelatase [Candidatus Oleimmundimicrobium sp.]|uniref:precorrin-2 dehydrogenase/sirohydrochlorin ferrochelatase family protein n=1 Tax=Candidatus Oleimmundimicrobium sp. TaxID=3060597 RepID=UPI002720DE27|nr:bifunctional precorrin-2 dehydrogenase/sirohydrochlorin ferrochelatase [Candidatus Oleimmundimicrobium sp.]MDO8885938.1 bifunctional precorrin-2 dehydrogenase/sirohydrochlorin ferrochelatase [Candidatus Oleimmundimicrobium sp.]
MTYYPVYLNLKNKKCVVVGGGNVAERKVLALIDCGAKVTVISPKLTKLLERLKSEGKIEHIGREYEKGDLKGAFVVIGATDNSSVNKEIYKEASALNLLVNIVDVPEICNFIVPSLVRRGDLTISISTSGKAPALAKKIRLKLEKEFGPEYEPYLNLLGEIREKIKEKYDLADERNKAWGRILESNILKLIRDGKDELLKEIIKECI